MTDLVDKKEAIQAIEEATGDQPDENDQVEIKKKHQELVDQKLKAQLDRREQLAIIDMRGAWSEWILRTILAVTLFDFFVIAMVGWGFMSCPNSGTLPFFIGESLLKTLGLALIIVNFLFNKKSLYK